MPAFWLRAFRLALSAVPAGSFGIGAPYLQLSADLVASDLERSAGLFELHLRVLVLVAQTLRWIAGKLCLGCGALNLPPCDRCRMLPC